MAADRRSYLERYRAGEHVAVWSELAALGADVRREPVYSDARAVARETMTRVRHNVELLAARLRALGYRFIRPDEAVVPPTPELLERLDRIEAEAGPLPLSVRAFFEVVGSVDFMGSHPRLSAYAASPTLSEMVEDTRAAIAEQAPSPRAAPAPAAIELPPDAPPQLAALFGQLGGAGGPLGNAMSLARELMRRVQEVQEDSAKMIAEGGEMPERLRANHQLAQGLQLRMAARSDAANQVEQGPVSDPLVVWAPYDDDLEELRELGDPDDPEARDEEGWTGRYVIDIAPDVHHKSNYSGGGPYQIAFPDPGADAAVLELGAPSFVGYLRECFRWGGFPGLADETTAPADELARLTEGLLEI